VPSWSAWGYTLDGFSKPELSAPDRAIVGPVPSDSTLAAERPAQLLSTPGGLYMTLSGTSLSAPIVSGIVADLLALRPALTPDQVKGALMHQARAGLVARRLGRRLLVGRVVVGRVPVGCLLGGRVVVGRLLGGRVLDRCLLGRPGKRRLRRRRT